MNTAALRKQRADLPAVPDPAQAEAAKPDAPIAANLKEPGYG